MLTHRLSVEVCHNITEMAKRHEGIIQCSKLPPEYLMRLYNFLWELIPQGIHTSNKPVLSSAAVEQMTAEQAEGDAK